VIAGAMKNDNGVVFLFLTATIQDMPEVKQEEPVTTAPSN